MTSLKQKLNRVVSGMNNTNYMMKYLLILLMAASGFISYAQDKETMAQALYMSAENAYNENNFLKAEQKLKEARQTLGKSNAKIEYLLVKSLMEQKKYFPAKQELTEYFKLAEANKGSDKYNEMLALLGDINDLAIDPAIVAKLSPFLDKLTTAMASDKATLFAYLHPRIRQTWASEAAYIQTQEDNLEKLLTQAASAKGISRKRLSMTQTKPVTEVTRAAQKPGLIQAVVSFETHVTMLDNKTPLLKMKAKYYGICESSDDGNTWTYVNPDQIPVGVDLKDFYLLNGISIPKGTSELE